MRRKRKLKISARRIARTAIDANVKLSRALDSILPARVREDGNKTFTSEFLPRAVKIGSTVYDLGGGSRPFVTLEDKKRLGLTVVGLDVDAEELAAAPPGIYDYKIVADLCTFEGSGDADVVICQATLEHVPDTAGAMRALATTVKPGGRIFIFAPCRNALFARLNLALPQRIKKCALYALFPKKAQGHDGFKAYYDRCTPREIEVLAAANGLEIEECRLFWISSYFTVFTPAFLAWRAWQGMSYLVIGENAAETFVYVLKYPAPRRADTGNRERSTTKPLGETHA